MVRGSLLGALVVGQRPGEHYVADERELLFHVAHEVGAALFALRARESQAFVRAVAQGALNPEEARKQAIRLETAWVMV